jgi:hypothetical protein
MIIAEIAHFKYTITKGKQKNEYDDQGSFSFAPEHCGIKFVLKGQRHTRTFL